MSIFIVELNWSSVWLRIKLYFISTSSPYYYLAYVSSETHNLQRVLGPGGEVPFIGYIGTYHAKGYGFLAVLVWNRVSISTILVWNGVGFVHRSLELGMFIRRISFFFII